MAKRNHKKTAWRRGATKHTIDSSYFLTTTRAPTYFLASLFSIEFSIARWTTRTDARHTMRVWDWGAPDAPEAAHERCWDNKLCVSPRGAQSPSEKVCQRLAKPASGSEFRASLTATMVLTQTKPSVILMLYSHRQHHLHCAQRHLLYT